MRTRLFFLFLVPLFSGCNFGSDTAMPVVGVSGETTLSGNQTAPEIEKVYTPPMSPDEISSLEKDPDTIDCNTLKTEKKDFCQALKTGQEYSRMIQAQEVSFNCTTLRYTENQSSCVTRNQIRKKESIIRDAKLENDIKRCNALEDIEERDSCRIQVVLYPIIANELYKTASGMEMLRGEGLFQDNYEYISERDCMNLSEYGLVDQCKGDETKTREYLSETFIKK